MAAFTVRVSTGSNRGRVPGLLALAGSEVGSERATCVGERSSKARARITLYGDASRLRLSLRKVPIFRFTILQFYYVEGLVSVKSGEEATRACAFRTVCVVAVPSVTLLCALRDSSPGKKVFGVGRFRTTIHESLEATPRKARSVQRPAHYKRGANQRRRRKGS